MATKLITLAEFREHITKVSLWVLLHGNVYDATKFIDEHPGGDEVLLSVTGKDATEAFEDVGHSDEARSLLDAMKVGEFSNEPKQNRFNLSTFAKLRGILNPYELVQQRRISSLPAQPLVSLAMATNLITLAELREHSTKASLWVLLHGNVYDATKFIDEHPGGEEYLLSVAGKDATESFEEFGHSDEARSLLDAMKVGEFEKGANEPKQNRVNLSTGPQTQERPQHPLATQSERDHHLAQLTDELALKRALPEQAEANAVEAARRADDRQLMMTSLLKQRDVELVDVQSSLKDVQSSLKDVQASLKDMQASLRDMPTKFDELLLSRDQQIGQYEKELANVRAKLEAKESESEAARLRLKDAEKDLAKSKAETDALRAQTASGSVNRDEDRVSRLMERVRAIEAEMTSRQWNEKRIEDMECRNEG